MILLKLTNHNRLQPVLKRMKGIKKYFALLFLIQPLTMLLADEGQNKPLLYRIGFQQSLNSYSWLSQINYKRNFFGKGILKIDESYKSLMIRLGQDDHKWKDDQRLNVNLFYPYSRYWGMSFSVSANNFSDRLSGLVSDIKTNWAKIGFRLQPVPKIELHSAIGYKFDDRLARTDEGITYDIRLKTDSLNIN